MMIKTFQQQWLATGAGVPSNSSEAMMAFNSPQPSHQSMIANVFIFDSFVL